VGLLLLGTIGLVGCESTSHQVQPPKPPEEFRDPPENDPRYSGPIQYPRDTLDQDPLLKKARDASKNPQNPLNGPRSPGSRMGGMGGMGY
jgi:hypothetical protein